MIEAGDAIEHPVTRERIVFRKTARDTGGTLAQADFYLQPGGFVAAEHIHPRQDEHFEVIAGMLCGSAGGKEIAAGPGERVVIPAGTPHVWWGVGDEEMHALVELRPALRTEVFLETLFGLAQDGKVSRKSGLPNPLQMAVLMREYRAEIVLARPPRAVQAVLFGVLAFIGGLCGYRAEYRYPRAVQARTQVKGM